MRYLYLILFAIVLGLPFALAAIQRQSQPVAQVQQATARLVIVTPHNGDIRREYAIAFDQWHRQKYGQGVAIDFRVPGGTTDLVRLLTSTFKENKTFAGLDLVWGGGDYTFYHDLQPLGILDPIHLDPRLLCAAFPEDALAGVRLYDATKAA